MTNAQQLQPLMMGPLEPERMAAAPSEVHEADPASAWVTRTPKQRARAAARYDREAREIIAAFNARRTEEARAAHVAKARRHADAFSTLLLRGHKANGESFTRDELACMRDCLKDAWKTLKRFDSEFVTVLS